MTEKVYNELDEGQQSTDSEGSHDEGSQGDTQPESAPTQQETKGAARNRKSAGNTTKAAENKAKAASKVSQPAISKKRNGKPLRTYTIILNDSSQFPPGGLVIGKNGQFKKIQPEVPTKLDEYWMEVLNHAVQTEARRDDNGRVVGLRNVPRFPYRIVPDNEE